MLNLRRTTATLGAMALIATPLTLVTASPASAADREFRYAGADVEFDVEKDDGSFEVEVDIDDARPGSRWKIVLRHDGTVFHRKVHTASGDGDVEVDKDRRNTAGRDVFKLRLKKIGTDRAVTRIIRTR